MYDPSVPHLMDLVPVGKDAGHEGDLGHGPDQGRGYGGITFGGGEEGA